ncbi:methylated-DNA--[protein]-cysteine S-methyltransferase [Trueperella pyogenes]|uniref:methylated-DNA--[protein]-cysteine S-methyltransferase n=2 Tax=Trueperella pyogenes TaxID=1661 RepID=UPI00312B89B6
MGDLHLLAVVRPPDPPQAVEDMYTTYLSPIGRLIIHDDGVLRGLWTEDNAPSVVSTRPATGPVAAWLDAYFAGENPQVTFPVEPEGTEFQQAVWEALRDIPYGQTRTYGQLAAAVGKSLARSTSARAIGAALGKNPILIVVPCHRVVGADGTLTGYAGGLERKRALLTLENAPLRS